MKLLLRSDVHGLGKRGDLVEVPGGYARNFLLPTGQALPATPGISAQATAMRRGRDLRNARDREAAESVASVLVAATITVSARAGSEGRLFGSVTASDLAEAVQAQTGAAVDRRKIMLDEPIKALGSHAVPLKLHGDVEIQLNVEVVAS